MGKGYSFVAEFVRIRPKMGKIRQQQNHTVDSVTDLKSENLVVCTGDLTIDVREQADIFGTL